MYIVMINIENEKRKPLLTYLRTSSLRVKCLVHVLPPKFIGRLGRNVVHSDSAATEKTIFFVHACAKNIVSSLVISS
jgi:hypothetical protein